MTVRPVLSLASAVAIGAAACAAPGPPPPPSPAGPAPAGPVTYIPGTARYRRASHLYVEQEVGGQLQRINEVLVYLFTATLTGQGDRLTVSVTVDSVPRYESDASATGVASRARGTTFTGDVAPSGEITGPSGGDSSSKLLQQLAEDFRALYPRLPATGAVPGSQWTDTTETTTRSGGLPLSMVAVSRHEADTIAGVGADRVLPIRTLTTYTFSGTGAQGGQVYAVRGEGRRHTVNHLTDSGRFLGGLVADTSRYTISLTGLDLSIPARQTRADTVQLIP